jgi:hypothetical protein
VAVTGETVVDLRPLRLAGLALIPAALVLKALPFSPVPPCPLRTLTGVPCPLCGSTRGVIAAVHGDIAGAITLNPASLIVLVLAVMLVIGWRVERVRIPVWLIVAVFAALWTYQMFKYTTGQPL